VNRIYKDAMMPLHWVVGDLAGEMWVVPATAGGWVLRSRYAVPPSLRAPRLEEVPATVYAHGLGIPDLERRTVETVRG
jgi:hypothetical protein